MLASTASARATLEPDALLAFLSTTYGLNDASFSDLGGELDRNLKVVSSSGEHVLKIASTVTSLEGLALENEVLDALAGHDLGVASPRVIRSLDGQATTSLALPSGEHSARLLTWVDGQVLGDVEHRSPDLLEDCGRVAARVSLALRDLDTPALQRSHHWDLRVVDASVRECLPFVADENHRALAEVTLAWHAEHVAARQAELPLAPSHHDLNDHNLLVEERSGDWRVSGVLDVGDALVSLRCGELAITAAYAALRQPDPLAAVAAVTRGYLSVEPLTDDELAVIYPLAAIRLATNATTWTRRQVEAGGAFSYAITRSQHTWASLERFVSTDPTTALEMIRASR